MSNITVLTEESLGLVAGGKKCDGAPSQNSAELWRWARNCARIYGGQPHTYFMDAYDRFTTEQPQEPKKQPKK